MKYSDLITHRMKRNRYMAKGSSSVGLERSFDTLGPDLLEVEGREDCSSSIRCSSSTDT